jgi:hypothetical protein
MVLQFYFFLNHVLYKSEKTQENTMKRTLSKSHIYIFIIFLLIFCTKDHIYIYIYIYISRLGLFLVFPFSIFA